MLHRAYCHQELWLITRNNHYHRRNNHYHYHRLVPTKQTRKLGSDRPAAKREAMLYFGIESALSLVVAVVINLFITGG